MKIKVANATGKALDWLVAQCEGQTYNAEAEYSASWSQGGPIIERKNITIIRADDTYKVDASGYTTLERVPQWFAETSQWTGHSLCTSYEGECFDPAFMIGEADGHYGTTPLIAAMRCYVASRIGRIAEVPDEMMI